MFAVQDFKSWPTGITDLPTALLMNYCVGLSQYKSPRFKKKKKGTHGTFPDACWSHNAGNQISDIQVTVG